jgi:hypothetical protein
VDRNSDNVATLYPLAAQFTGSKNEMPAKIEGESKQGMHSQSSDPRLLTSAAVWQLPIKA